MSCSKEDQINDAIINITIDSEKFHDIVQGDDTTVVQTENGPVNSAAKAIKEIGGNIYKNYFRNTGLTIATDGNEDGVTDSDVPVVDNWFMKEVTGGEALLSRSTLNPSDTSQYSLYFDVTSSDFTIGASHEVDIHTDIVGFDVADLMYGTADAKTVTITFKIRAKITGIHTLALTNGVDRTYVSEYEIMAADTWEQFEITIPGCPDGTWLIDDGLGLKAIWCLGAGSNLHTGSLDTWNSDLKTSSANQVNQMHNASRYVQLQEMNLIIGEKFNGWEPPKHGETDLTAIHTDNANEISGVAEKTTLVSGDLVLIEDSEAGYIKKKVNVDNLPGNGGGGVAEKTDIPYAEYQAHSYAGGTTLNAGDIVKYTNKVLDANDDYNTTTGKYTAPTAGVLEISFGLNFDVSVGASLVLYKNDAIHKLSGSNTADGMSYWKGDGQIAIDQGDTISVRVQGTSIDLDAGGTVPSSDFISFRLIPHQVAIGATSELTSLATVSVVQDLAGNNVPVKFDDITYDPEGLFDNTGAGTVWTCPVGGAGPYHIVTSVGWDYDTTDLCAVQIFKNGTVEKFAGRMQGDANTAGGETIQCVTIMDLNVGDTIEVRADHDGSAPDSNTTGSSLTTRLEITRAGAGLVSGGLADQTDIPYCEYTDTTAESIAVGVAIPFDNAVHDPDNLFDGTEYTAPADGILSISGTIQADPQTSYLSVYKGASSYLAIGTNISQDGGAGVETLPINLSFKVSQGETFSIRTSTAGGIDLSSLGRVISFTLIPFQVAIGTGQVVAGVASLAGTQSIVGGDSTQFMGFDTVDKVTGGIEFTGSGLTWRCTVPDEGWYDIHAVGAFATEGDGDSRHILIVDDAGTPFPGGRGTQIQTSQINDTGQHYPLQATALVYLTAGQKVGVRVFQSREGAETNLNIGGDTSQNAFHIHKVSVVNGEGVTEITSILGTDDAITYTTNGSTEVSYNDSGNYDPAGLSSGTDWTCPVSGRYEIKQKSAFGNTSVLDGLVFSAEVYKNTTQMSSEYLRAADANGNHIASNNITVNLVQGDVITVQENRSNAGGSTSLVRIVNPTQNYLHINKV